MNKETESLSRRGFLKLPAIALGGAAVNRVGKYIDIPTEENVPENAWPRFRPEMLPEGEIKEVLTRIPALRINSEGYLTANGEAVPFAETDWSRTNREIIHPNALVVHWNGHPEPDNATVLGILSGYDELRTSRDGTHEYTTSAHVTIGPYSLEEVATSEPSDNISLLQTQAPEEGLPTVSSHIRIDLTPEHLAYLTTDHPMNAMRVLFPYYHLERDYSYLTEVLENPSVEDLNLNTISLELMGLYFDSPESHPNPQLIANTAAAVIAYLTKYPEIRFSNINGHFEIQMDKADPGKKFMAELRLILGLHVLSGRNETLKENFFGPFMTESGNKMEAAKRFFDFYWDYLVASSWGHPKEVYRWEAQTGFWKIYNSLFVENPPLIADRFISPVEAHDDRRIIYGYRYAEPDFHEGLDINVQATRRIINEDLGEPIKATANGKVIFANEIPGTPGLGKTMVVEHILPTGAKVLSLYAHLNEFRAIRGENVEAGQEIATMGNSGGQQDSHLHFAILPASAKRVRELNFYLQSVYERQAVDASSRDEQGRIYIVPATVGRNHVWDYYFDPLGFISENS